MDKPTTISVLSKDGKVETIIPLDGAVKFRIRRGEWYVSYGESDPYWEFEFYRMREVQPFKTYDGQGHLEQVDPLCTYATVRFFDEERANKLRQVLEQRFNIISV